MKTIDKNMRDKLAKDMRLPAHEIERVMMHQWKYLGRLISNGSFLGVRWPILGQFVARTTAVRTMLTKNSWKRLLKSKDSPYKVKTVSSNLRIRQDDQAEQVVLNQFDI